MVRSDIHQFDSRVEEIERQLQRALLSYGVSTPVSGGSGEAGSGDSAGERNRGSSHVAVMEENSSTDNTS